MEFKDFLMDGKVKDSLVDRIKWFVSAKKRDIGLFLSCYVMPRVTMARELAAYKDALMIVCEDKMDGECPFDYFRLNAEDCKISIPCDMSKDYWGEWDCSGCSPEVFVDCFVAKAKGKI